MKIKKKLLFVFLTTSTSFLFVFAQISSTISLSPENPEPNSTVELTLESYSFDTGTAMITWKVNNKIVAQGQGVDSYSLPTGSVGQSTKVTVSAITGDGSAIEQEVVVTPSSVSLLYEAPKSYTPLLYKGRSLPGDGALFTVTAFPQISENNTIVPPSSLAYTWYLNDSIMQSYSGVGKQSAELRIDYLRSKNTVRVIVRSQKGNIASKTITVQPHEPMPLLYLYDPIFGSMFTQLVGKRFETIKDFTLSLEPFYVTQEDEGDSSEYTWFLDGLLSTPSDGRVLGFHPKENSYGIKNLTIKVYGADRRLQQTELETEILFDTRK